MTPARRPHRWFTISVHPSSAGAVTYQRGPCGRWRTLQEHTELWRQADTGAGCRHLAPVPGGHSTDDGPSAP